MEDHESELERLGQAVTSARARLQEFDDSGQQGNLVEHARLKQEVDQADAAFHQARRARPLIRRFGTWVGDFVQAIVGTYFKNPHGGSGL